MDDISFSDADINSQCPCHSACSAQGPRLSSKLAKPSAAPASRRCSVALCSFRSCGYLCRRCQSQGHAWRQSYRYKQDAVVSDGRVWTPLGAIQDTFNPDPPSFLSLTCPLDCVTPFPQNVPSGHTFTSSSFSSTWKVLFRLEAQRLVPFSMNPFPNRLGWIVFSLGCHEICSNDLYGDYWVL